MPYIQYTIFLAFVIIGFFLSAKNFLNVVFGGKALEIEKGSDAPGLEVFISLVICGLGMYLTWSLFSYHPEGVGYYLLIVHWAGTLSTFLMTLSNLKKRTIDFSGWRSFYSVAYSTTLLLLSLEYGLTLWLR